MMMFIWKLHGGGGRVLVDYGYESILVGFGVGDAEKKGYTAS